jgi:hypothetical protein
MKLAIAEAGWNVRFWAKRAYSRFFENTYNLLVFSVIFGSAACQSNKLLA